MSAIVVCPLSRLQETVKRHRARHVVTLINQGTPVPRPPGIAEADHLTIHTNDIIAPADGMTCPGEAHVEALLAFARRWDRETPLVVHCFAGVSRSTAAAYAAFSALRPDLGEEEVATRLRHASPQATPNALIVRLADAALGRGGRMIAAIERIGRGAECFEGSVFALRLGE